jgi:hypothetical protein
MVGKIRLFIFIALAFTGCSLSNDLSRDTGDQTGNITPFEGTSAFVMTLAECRCISDPQDYQVTNAAIILTDPQGNKTVTNWRQGSPTNIVFPNRKSGSYILTVIETDTLLDKYTNSTQFILKKGYDDVLRITLGGNILVEVKFYNANRTVIYNTIYPWFSVRNIGKAPVRLGRLKLRYYYTVDYNTTQLYTCDYCAIKQKDGYLNKTSSVYSSYIKVDPPVKLADRVLELGFYDSIGWLNAGETIFIQSRVHNIQWLNYNQGNDYSFDPNDCDYANWQKVTAIYNNRMIFGVIPK